MATAVGVPTTRGLRDALGDFGVGAVGGLGAGMVTGIFGNNLLGWLAAAVLMGAAIKGNRGEIIATLAGFMAIGSLLGTSTAAASSGVTQETM